MDYKEQILAVSKVLRRWFGTGFDKQMTPAREVIEALPSEKEIARGQIEEYIGEDGLGDLRHDDVLIIEDIFDWLGKEAE